MHAHNFHYIRSLKILKQFNYFSLFHLRFFFIYSIILVKFFFSSFLFFYFSFSFHLIALVLSSFHILFLLYQRMVQMSNSNHLICMHLDITLDSIYNFFFSPFFSFHFSIQWFQYIQNWLLVYNARYFFIIFFFFHYFRNFYCTCFFFFLFCIIHKSFRKLNS